MPVPLSLPSFAELLNSQRRKKKKPKQLGINNGHTMYVHGKIKLDYHRQLAKTLPRVAVNTQNIW